MTHLKLAHGTGACDDRVFRGELSFTKAGHQVPRIRMHLFNSGGIYVMSYIPHPTPDPEKTRQAQPGGAGTQQYARHAWCFVDVR